MTLVLRPHDSVSKPRWQISGEIHCTGLRLTWSMRVQGPSEYSWDIHQGFGRDYRKNWELWNHDVLELFLQLRSHPADLQVPYLELQISPGHQMLALIILKPRISCYVPLGLELNSVCQVAPGEWTTQVTFELPRELGVGIPYGGFFACLGGPQREFYALEPNAEAKPDYHRPELFRRL